MGAMNKASRRGECKSDLEIDLELGKRLNPQAWPYDSPEDFFDKLIEPEYGFKFDDLRKIGCYQPGYTYRKYEKAMLRPDGEPGFNTVTGKVELYSIVYEAWGDDPLPYFEEAALGPGEPSGTEGPVPAHRSPRAPATTPRSIRSIASFP